MTKNGAWVGAIALALATAMAGCGSDEGSVEAYGLCEESSECAAGVEGCGGVRVDYVDRITEERTFCTSVCTSDDQCPPDADGVPGACGEEFGGPDALCFRRCTSDDDCPADFGCVDRLPAPGGGESRFDPICLPVR